MRTHNFLNDLTFHVYAVKTNSNEAYETDNVDNAGSRHDDD